MRQFVVVLTMAAAFAACGDDSPTGPGNVTVISGSTGSAGPTGATITITASGVSPQAVTVNVGQSVTFVNNDSRGHEIASNPHPQHGSCPSIEGGLTTISPGQTKLTFGFSGAGTCSFHDHSMPTDGSLQGTITIR